MAAFTAAVALCLHGEPSELTSVTTVTPLLKQDSISFRMVPSPVSRTREIIQVYLVMLACLFPCIYTIHCCIRCTNKNFGKNLRHVPENTIVSSLLLVTLAFRCWAWSFRFNSSLWWRHCNANCAQVWNRTQQLLSNNCTTVEPQYIEQQGDCKIFAK